MHVVADALVTRTWSWIPIFQQVHDQSRSIYSNALFVFSGRMGRGGSGVQILTLVAARNVRTTVNTISPGWMGGLGNCNSPYQLPLYLYWNSRGHGLFGASPYCCCVRSMQCQISNTFNSQTVRACILTAATANDFLFYGSNQTQNGSDHIRRHMYRLWLIVLVLMVGCTDNTASERFFFCIFTLHGVCFLAPTLWEDKNTFVTE